MVREPPGMSIFMRQNYAMPSTYEHREKLLQCLWEKIKNLGIRGIPMIFIGYAKNHAGDCYCMCSHIIGYMKETRDIMWLHCMYYSKPEAWDKVIVYPQVALPFKLEDAEAREGVTPNASEPKIESKKDSEEWRTVHTRSGRVVKALVLYMKQ